LAERAWSAWSIGSFIDGAPLLPGALERGIISLLAW